MGNQEVEVKTWMISDMVPSPPTHTIASTSSDSSSFCTASKACPGRCVSTTVKCMPAASKMGWHSFLQTDRDLQFDKNSSAFRGEAQLFKVRAARDTSL